ncbi:MAG: folate-binding protein YgfZ [Sphingomonadales bacterium]|nr:folate-binding protein YgfZ [Sphingomonadales bacterium]MDE2568532.1 folate-binding protein YgfZ [Sphingomonadales bacterium]
MTATRLFDRAVVRLAPLDPSEDVAAFLQGLVTSDVKGVLPVWTALLTAQGKALFDFIVWPSGEHLLLDCESEAADALVKRLSLYRLRRKIAIARDDALGVHWQAGEGEGGSADPRLAALGRRRIAPVSDSDEGADTAWREHRLKLGVTEGRAELGDGETLWLEANAVELNGVSFSKGCYVGQENTARMNWRQKVNRRLLVVPLNASDEKRRRATYPELGLAVDHLRVEDIAPDWAPAWMDLFPTTGED